MRLTLEPWGPADVAVLQIANTPEMTHFLGGPEDAADLATRHAQYLEMAETGDGAMFRVEVEGEIAGYAGWWTEEHEGEPVSEVGCAVVPEWQGRGVASESTRRVIALALEANGLPVVGYADTANDASNALCRRVGFELRGTGVFPSDAGDMAVNIWVIDPTTWLPGGRAN